MGHSVRSVLEFICLHILILTICNVVFSVLGASDSQYQKIITENFSELSLETSRETNDATENLNEEDIITDHDIIKKCGRSDKCTIDPKNPWDSDSIKRICRCDDESICLEYGDCCRTIAKKIVKKNPWKCSLVQSKTWALMISSCYSNNSTENLEKLCTLQSLWEDDYTYQLDLPVYSKSGKFYRNINCALCSGASFDEINSLNVRILCNKNLSKTQADEFVKESLYKTGERYWEYFDIFCGLYIPELDALQINETNPKTRFCITKVVDSCPFDWGDNRISKLCSSYMQPVNSRSNRIFKNPHCAQCNGIDNITKDVACYLDPITQSPKRIESDLILGPRGYQLIHDYTCEMRSLLQENDSMNARFIIADCLNYNSNLSSAIVPIFPAGSLLLYIISIIRLLSTIV